jgi:hypothetical protein
MISVLALPNKEQNRELTPRIESSSLLADLETSCEAPEREHSCLENAPTEGHWEENDSYNSKLLHRFILIGGDGVENEVNHVVARSSHLIQRFRH